MIIDEYLIDSNVVIPRKIEDNYYINGNYDNITNGNYIINGNLNYYFNRFAAYTMMN